MPPTSGINAFNANPQKLDIEIEIFGKTTDPITDLERIAIEVPKKLLTSEKRWARARKSQKYYRRYAMKIYRYLPYNSESWRNVRNYLDKIRKGRQTKD